MVKLYNGTIIARDQYHLLDNTNIPPIFKSPIEYDEYLLDCIRRLLNDNIIFYQIPEHFIMYSEYSEPDVDIMTLYFNVIDVDSPSVYEYTLKFAINAVALDMPSNVDILMATAITNGDLDTVSSLTNHKMIDVMTHLCSIGYDSAIIRNNKIPMICVCFPKKLLSNGKKVSF